jgi:hypothetical protein
LAFLRYVATEAKPDQVIYMDAGKCVNSFVYRVLINRTTESRKEDRKSRIAEAFSSTATLGCAGFPIIVRQIARPHQRTKAHSQEWLC